MRAAVFKDIGVLAIEDRPEPGIEDDHDVLVRVAACGICGTDLHILSDPPGHPGTPGIVLGHEFVGDVVAVGRQVHGVLPGDRVAVRPIVSCGVCATCLAGMPNLCEGADAMGVYRDGGLASLVVVPESACIPLDRSVPIEVAALTEPLACITNAVGKAAPMPGDSVAILGAGPIGLMFLAVLRSAGTGPITVVEPTPQRASVATTLGADLVIDPTTTNAVLAIQEALPVGADIVIDAVGSQLGVAVEVAAGRGRIVLFGMDSRAHPEVSQYRITDQELSIFGSYVGQHSFPDAIRMLESGRLDLRPIVSHVVGLEELPATIDAARRGEVVKAVVLLDSD
jgi:threonine dehydrogenase-like Zn-dependent dehydrogenase